MADGSAIGRHQPKLRKAFQWLAVLMFVLLAVQPALGGWLTFRNREVIDIHAIVANTMYLIGVLLVILAMVAGFTRKTTLAGWSILLLVMLTAQMGLGYGAREERGLAAFHIPLGVFSFGVGLILVLLAYGFSTRREQV